jgi:hypothetical protein
MAAPVKNLVDATSLTMVPNTWDVITNIKVNKIQMGMWLDSNFAVQIPTVVPRWTIPLILGPIGPIPFTPIVGFTTRIAANAVVITFPPIYKERTGSRPTEGQLYPLGVTKYG